MRLASSTNRFPTRANIRDFLESLEIDFKDSTFSTTESESRHFGNFDEALFRGCLISTRWRITGGGSGYPGPVVRKAGAIRSQSATHPPATLKPNTYQWRRGRRWGARPTVGISDLRNPEVYGIRTTSPHQSYPQIYLLDPLDKPIVTGLVFSHHEMQDTQGR